MTDPAQTYSVYRLTCRETGKAYVGVTYPTMKGAVEALGLRGYGELYRLLSDTDSGVALAEKNQ